MESSETQEAVKKPEKIRLAEINSYLTCYLCKGYLIDATTISECLHSFCRSCIIKFLEDNSHCPVCEVIINKAKPNLKLDKTLQDIVYKLVPELFLKEMSRRRSFYLDYPEVAAKVSPEERGEDIERTIFNPQDFISLSIEYISDDSTPGAIRLPVEPDKTNIKRYLQCPGMCRIDVLKKFVRNKYSVDTNKFHIDILYKRVPLPDHYTLIDIAYIYSWKRNEPMTFYFRITDLNKVTERFDYFDGKPLPDLVVNAPVRTKKRDKRIVKPKTDQIKCDSVKCDKPDNNNEKSDKNVYTNITLNRANNMEIITKIQKVSNKDGHPIGLNIIKQTVKKASPCSSANVSITPKPPEPEIVDEKTKFLHSIELTAKNTLPMATKKRKLSSPIKNEKAKKKIILQSKSDVVLSKNYFSDRKINIPSSLSIILKDSAAGDSNPKPQVPQVNNFIEILRIDEKKPKVEEDSDQKIDEDLSKIALSLTEKIPQSTTISTSFGPKNSFQIPIKTVPKYPIQPSPIPDVAACKILKSDVKQTFQTIFEESIKKSPIKTAETPETPSIAPTQKRNISEIISELSKKNQLENEKTEPKVAIPRLPNNRKPKPKPKNGFSSPVKSPGDLSIVLEPEPEKKPSAIPKTVQESPKNSHSPKSSPVVKHMYSPRVPSPNLTLDKYNMQNLSQLTNNSQLAQAMLLKHFELQNHQNWLNLNQYLQNLPQNQILGNLKEN